MVDENRSDQDRIADDLAQLAEESAPGLLREFFDYLRCNKKWWLAPAIVALLILGVFVLLTSTAAAPFIYALF